MTTSPTIQKIMPALLLAQQAMGSAKKDAKNPFFRSNYADLGSVMEVCKDALNKHGITVLQPVQDSFVETLLIHSSGEFMTSFTRIVCKEQNNPQAYGSAITYARRYGLQSMLFIPAEDDDGNSATRRVEPRVVPVKDELDTYTNPEALGIAMATDKQISAISKMVKQGKIDSAIAQEIPNMTRTRASEIISTAYAQEAA
jgi:hypothetical protein